MAVLVTGGAGYVGSHLAWALADRGEDVVVVDDLRTGFAEVLPPGTELVRADIADEARLEAVFAARPIDAVIHCAASTVVPQSLAEPLSYYDNNLVGPVKLLRAAAGAGVRRFVFSSTAAVYAPPLDGALVDEDSLTAPASPYGASKLMTERIFTDAAAAHGLSCVILRYFNVAGADPVGRCGQSTPEATHLIKVCAEAALGLRPGVTIYGDDYPTPDGTGVRDFIHVSDLAEVHMHALAQARAEAGVWTYNCGYGRGHSVLEVVAALKRVSGVDFPVARAPRRPGDLARVVADPSKVKARYGWRPRFDDLDLIARHALDWERRRLASGA